MFINRSLDVNVGPKFITVNNNDILEVLTKVANNRLLKAHWSKTKDRLIASIDFKEYAIDDASLGGYIVPRLYVRNCNTGGEALSIGIGLYRLICANGLMMRFNDLFSARIRHVSGPKINSFLDELPTLIENQVESITSGEVFDSAYEASQVLIKNPIDVVASLPVSNTVKDRAIAQIVNQTHRAEDNPHTAWGLYNLVNELSRLRSRTEYNALNKDIGLLDHVLLLAA
jgi:hypothetical protein